MKRHNNYWSVSLLLLAAFLIGCARAGVTGDHDGDRAEPVLVEVPGYAKLVLGSYGEHYFILIKYLRIIIAPF